MICASNFKKFFEVFGGEIMEKYRVYYKHTSSTGGTTTGFKDILANSSSDARAKFNQMYDSSYKVTSVEKI